MVKQPVFLGKFITFEGGEGVGKSTQSRLLSEYINTNGQRAIWTREPGGSPGAEAIRNLIVRGEGDKWPPYSEFFLIMAARVDHWYKTIKPALEQGCWVICDRFMDSTIAYQGYGRGLSLDFLQQTYRASIGPHYPDRTYILDVCPTVGLLRAQQRLCQSNLLQSENSANIENRFESLAIDFHKRVREGFLNLATQNPKRYLVINGDQHAATIQQKITADFWEIKNTECPSV